MQISLIKKPIIFLHRCLQNLSTVVCYLSITTLLPAEYLALIIQCSLFSPPHITTLVFITSFALTLLSDPYHSTKSSPSISIDYKLPFYHHFKDIERYYINSKINHLVFGLCKGLQSLTVISYIRASCSLRSTYRTPATALTISLLSTIASLLGSRNKPNGAYIVRETIDFVFNTATSVGFLYLLNYSSPWSLQSLGLGLTALTALSIIVETDAYKKANSVIQETIRSLSPSKKPTRSASSAKRAQQNNMAPGAWTDTEITMDPSKTRVNPYPRTPIRFKPSPKSNQPPHKADLLNHSPNVPTYTPSLTKW